MSFIPKLIVHIRILNTILKRKRRILEIDRNKVNIVILPTKAPKKSRFNDAFLFNVLLTVRSKRKSKNKFRKNTKST